MPNLDSQSLPRRSVRKSASANVAGSLRGDLATVAMRVVEVLHQSDITVWTNVSSDRFFDAPERSPNVASEWLAGTYGVGASAIDN